MASPAPATVDQLKAVKDRTKRVIDEQLAARTFSSGSRGYWVQSRETIDGVKFMVNIQVIEVGSKNRQDKEDSPN